MCWGRWEALFRGGDACCGGDSTVKIGRRGGDAWIFIDTGRGGRIFEVTSPVFCGRRNDLLGFGRSPAIEPLIAHGDSGRGKSNEARVKMASSATDGDLRYWPEVSCVSVVCSGPLVWERFSKWDRSEETGRCTA